MPSMIRACASGIGASLVLLATSAPALAAPEPIGGKLSRPGYTVIALAADGQARTAIAPAGGFGFVPPADAVTLHLRAPDGTYAGPIVVKDTRDIVGQARAAVRKAKRKLRRAKRKVRAARHDVLQADGDRAEKRLKRAKKRRRRAARRLERAKRALERAKQEAADRPNWAVVGVRAGAALGDISIRSGYALAREVPEPVWKTSVDSERRAQAVAGVPIGAGNFGAVVSRPEGVTLVDDLDVDGVPDPLDIDDDGDLILDELDSAPVGVQGRASQGSGCGPANIYCPPVSSLLNLFFAETVNANAGSTVAQIDSALRSYGVLRFGVNGDGLAGHSGLVELDCGDPDTGLVYCRQNGSTATASARAPGGAPFPGPPGGTVDADSDGFGLLDPALEPFACGSGPCPGSFFLLHGASSQQIRSGDVLVEHVTTSGDPDQCPPPPGVTRDACVSLSSTVQYVFATSPALVRYADTAGNSSTVSYPVAADGLGTGTGGNGFPVAPGPGGDIVVNLTFWRPQRRAIPDADPPTATWMDVGHLTYGMRVGGNGGFCPQSTFSENDPNLTVATPHVFLQGGGGFDDEKSDEASSPGDASPGRTFTFTLNLSDCFTALGVTFGSGDQQAVEFIGAPGAPSSASQTFFFKRQ